MKQWSTYNKKIIAVCIIVCIHASFITSVSAQEIPLDIGTNNQSSAFVKTNPVVKKLHKNQFRSDESISVDISNTQNNAVHVEVLDNKGKEADVAITQKKTMDHVTVALTPQTQFRPGKYTLLVTDKEGYRSQQDFRWGVLAINTNKSVYQPGQTAALSLAVLDDAGDMVCDAKLVLTITNKSLGINEKLSTDNGKIVVNPECHSHNFTLKPDYEATYLVGTSGTYEMTLTAQTKNGSFTITDSLVVKKNIPFDVERISSTRIYPPNNYPVTMKITAQQDFEGIVTETVPDSFIITPSDSATAYDNARTLYLEKKDDPAAMLTSQLSESSTQSGTLNSDILGASTSALLLPFVGAYSITQGFGSLETENILSKFYQEYSLSGHDGVDFGLPENTELFAIGDGTVIYADNGDYGKTVIIQHSWGKSYYGHLNNIIVQKDSHITKGSQIGFSGNTGESTGPHLHFGIKPNNPDVTNGYFGKVDPLPYFNLPATTLIASNLDAKVTESAVLGASTSAISSFTVLDGQLRKQALTSETIPTDEKVKVIQWHISLKKGETTTIGYTFKAPQISPQFYLLGPLRFYPSGDTTSKPLFQESRQWQIASDAVGSDWYNDGTSYGGYAWQYRKQVTIDHNKVGLPGYDAKSSSNQTSGTSLSWSHTVGSQSNMMLIVGVSTDNPATTVSNVTYNGVALTKLTTMNCSTQCRAEFWYLTAPATGAHNVVVTHTSGAIVGGAATYYDVNTSNPFGTPATATGTGNASNTATTVENNLVVDVVAQFGDTATVNSSQTQLWNNNTANTGAGSSKVATGTSTTMQWTFSASRQWADIAVPLNPVSLSSFPVLVNLSSDNDLKNNALSTGNDILFTDANGSKLDHEIEKYTSATGELIAWIDVSSLSTATDTSIYLYYGNASAANQQAATSVWDSNYKEVQHLEETGACAVTFTDSTSNAFNGSCNGSGPTANSSGQIGGGRTFNGSSQYISIANNSAFNPGSGAFTVEAWIRTTNTTAYQDIMSHFDGLGGWAFHLNSGLSNCPVSGFICLYDSNDSDGVSAGLSNNTWAHVVIVRLGTTATFYVNGTNKGTSTVQTTIPSTTNTERIGYEGDNSGPFSGSMDEVRYSNTNRTASWIKTEYNNQSSPSTFYTLGGVETKLYSVSPTQMMRHGQSFNTSGTIQPFVF